MKMNFSFKRQSLHTDPSVSALKRYVRAANYLSASQIFLKDNFLLKRPLQSSDIKPRLLGHWGTCPGINFLYAHVQRHISKYREQAIFVLGPGHGFPALQANLFIEGSLGAYYPKATHTEEGVGYIVKGFSWPKGFPSHSNPGTPGVILEGGELGYSLATAYGAVLDNPDLLAVCLVGDGEAETGPLATAWHLNKLIDPVRNGRVLPVLHLNGYKISGPTLFGRMKRGELESLFSGYGYLPIIVSYKDGEDTMHERMIEAMDAAREAFKNSRKDPAKYNPPMIVLETKKGWTGISELNGKKIEGNALSHQVVLKDPLGDPKELALLEKWLRSYHFDELFDPKTGFAKDIMALVPSSELRMGMNHKCFGSSKVCVDLSLPDPEVFLNPAVQPRGTHTASSMEAAGEYLRDVFKKNSENRNFRLFSPDETYSNKLSAVFEETSRSFVRTIEPWDDDLSRDGRVIEMLSEHSLQGLMQGYVLTGRHSVFASYEAFLQIISSMADQYIKFIRVAREIPWRGAVASLNYILTSPGWRQEHNGFSHQNPGFIDTMLQKHGCFVHVYFPPDRNTTILTLQRSLASKNEINLIVAGKSMEPEWLTPDEASIALTRGLLTWEFASDPDPEIVLAACGDYLTKETLAALQIVKKDCPEIPIRFVNIVELSAIGIGNTDCRVPFSDFDDYFTKDKPVIFNFHGYPESMKQALFDHQDGSARFSVHGYVESGTTTTPFDMHVRNGTSRFHIAREVLEKMAERGVVHKAKAQKLIQMITDSLKRHASYIEEHGVDMPDIEGWQWKR